MNTLADLGGLAGLAALVTAIGGVIVQLRGLRKVRRDTAQLMPNHGSHLADAVHRIEANMATRADVGEVRRLVGHEVGEVRDDQKDIKQRLSRLEYITSPAFPKQRAPQ